VTEKEAGRPGDEGKPATKTFVVDFRITRDGWAVKPDDATELHNQVLDALVLAHQVEADFSLKIRELTTTLEHLEREVWELRRQNTQEVRV